MTRAWSFSKSRKYPKAEEDSVTSSTSCYFLLFSFLSGPLNEKEKVVDGVEIEEIVDVRMNITGYKADGLRV